MDEFWDAADLGLDDSLLSLGDFEFDTLDWGIVYELDALADPSDFVELDGNAVEASVVAADLGHVTSAGGDAGATARSASVGVALLRLAHELHARSEDVAEILGDGDIEVRLRVLLDDFRALPDPFASTGTS